MIEKDFLLLVTELIENKSWKQLKQELGILEPHEAAELITAVSDHDGIIIFRLLNRETAKDTFANLELDEQETIIELLAADSRKLSELLNDLDPDDRTAFFEELPGKVSQRLMQMLSASERETATTLLGYPEESIGRLMTPDYVAVKPHFTIKQAFDHIRRFASKSETINIIYVVDDKWNLVDALSIETLILADPESHIEDIMDNRYIALNATDDQEEAVKAFSETDRVALPVIDYSGTLLGIVTVDDVMSVMEEESTEDFQRFGALQDAIVNPLKARIGLLYKQRVVWLMALVFMNVFSGAALGHFEDIIQSMVSLIFFLPLLIGSGGNAGSQSATLMIRAIAVGDVQMKDWFKLVGKEIAVSLLLGVTMALGVAVIAAFRATDVVLVVSITMVLIVMTGSLIGMLLPFIFTKLKLDPATASAPLITCISDITGVFIYFSVASVFLF